LDGGIMLRLSRKRVETLLRPLVELFGDVASWPERLELPKSRLAEAQDVEDAVGAAGLQWKTAPEVEELVRKLREFSHLTPLEEPPGFLATLRDYQKEGLAWLQFLREFGFGGILADDMGLGKTVQVLAHILMEKQAGRLDLPTLVVAPTSTLPNWRREAERFAPDLKLVVYHGPKRGERSPELGSSDIVITNYALLARDRELLKQAFHLAVLDEAQNVKNAQTASAKAARDLNARHRLCLSGTPIENHLDELWSLLHFLMPGFLGGQTEFRRRYRTPIEQKNDPDARAKLGRLVRPFMLRRTKQQVVKELPAKTEILETVVLDDQQRELYETLRLAMDERVRSLLADQGLARSRIQVLDALLKLRQVCCDPRLVKLPAAQSVTESAKLDRLMEMLEVLLEDGRKVLLFSQFTSMLDLIEGRLAGLQRKWVRITGETVDRETPVRQFEQGEAPLFLISLKAGGTGLNLVAADTVIHYDPWWNPAVENQATDRAYRIGQDKPVMVYKLITAGTVEEKIIELQRRKGDLAANILSETEDSPARLDAEDLRWLFSERS
jgi:SNF2 family DNA or RNA helicase